MSKDHEIALEFIKIYKFISYLCTTTDLYNHNSNIVNKATKVKFKINSLLVQFYASCTKRNFD